MKRKGNTKKVDELYDYLHDNFEYREDGNLVRLFDNGSRGKAGTTLGSKGGYKSNAYKQCIILGKGQQIHRLIFLFHEGYLPPFPLIVDHDDTNKLNNRIENLREKTRSENSFNSSKPNKHGYAGIYPTESGKKWIARIGGVKKGGEHLGTFDSKDEAVFARREAEMEHYGEYSSSYPQEVVEEEDCGHCNGTGKVRSSDG